MAWTTPRTWVAANTLTAAQLNTDVRDNMQALSGDGSNAKPSCRVYNSANISHTTSGSEQTLTFNSERWDVQSMHSTASLTSRITIPTGWGGKYWIGGNVEFAANATGTRYVVIKLNGGTNIAIQNSLTSLAGTATYLQVSTMYALAAGDYVELVVFQNSGGALNITASANYSPEFFALWVAV